MNTEQEISIIKERNLKVEADKAWETSIFRVILISAVTYLVAAFVFYVLAVSSYLLNAIIPTMGYLLSTQSIPFVKEWWIKNRYKK